MKRVTGLILFVFVLAAALPALAQDPAELITLNDATPAIDVVIALPPDTTGAIALDFSGAAVRLTDATGVTVFSAADARLHGVELNIAPNSGSHTLTIERLPGTLEAYVRVASLPELTLSGVTELVPTTAIALNQEVSLPLTTDHPGDTVNVSIPAGTIGVLSASFPGSFATTQTIDSTGALLVQSIGGHVDGMNLVLDGGAYDFTLLGSSLTGTVVAGVRAIAAADAGFAVLPAAQSTVAADAPVTTASCTATVAASSINLRSGPGTGYSVLGYGYRNQTFTVGGQNPENNWVVVATDTGSAWLANTNVQLQGDCTTLSVFNIPLLDAQPAPLVITSPQQGGAVIQPAGGYGYDDDDHEEGEDGEREDDD